LAAAIDKKALVEKVTKAGQIPTDAFTPPMSGFTPQPGIGYDVAKAKELLAQAGYPDGKGFPVLTIKYNTNEGHKKIAEFIQEQWQNNLGITVQLKNEEWKTFLDTRSNAHDFDVAAMVGSVTTGSLELPGTLFNRRRKQRRSLFQSQV
jgi:oligopeptide transport system substrate-binding protein